MVGLWNTMPVVVGLGKAPAVAVVVAVIVAGSKVPAAVVVVAVVAGSKAPFVAVAGTLLILVD
jgi:hypothetical protein